jgi:predicted NBD/HSP70 family sugar kinase
VEARPGAAVGTGMSRRGTNLPRVADYNQGLVLDLIRRTPGISRGELAAQTGLTAQTLSNISRRLLDARLIREAGRVHRGAGAPRTIYEIEPRGAHTVGLHIDPARLTLVVMDLGGDVVARAAVPTPNSDDPADVLGRVETAIRDLLRRTDVALEQTSGLGVATPGPVDVANGTVLGAPNLRGWNVVALQRDLERRLGIGVVIEKDTTAAAIGELWSSRDSAGSMVFVYLGTGVGAGVVLGGEVMRGASSNIGDIGHLSADPDGPRCPCGGRGCLSVTAMPATLVTEAVGCGLLPALDLGDPHAVETALAELCRLADASEPAALAIVERAARGFGRVAGQLANVLDLDSVVFGGPSWRPFERTFLRVVPPIVTALFVGRALHPVQVRGTVLGPDDAGDAAAVGAASLAMSSRFAAPAQLFLAD